MAPNKLPTPQTSTTSNMSRQKKKNTSPPSGNSSPKTFPNHTASTSTAISYINGANYVTWYVQISFSYTPQPRSIRIHPIHYAPLTSHQALDPSSSTLIGIIICKLEPHRSGTFRGYIAMLAVSSPYRGRGIASRLVSMAIDAMRARDADEVVLETEVTNTASLKLYERLGFLRSKRLHRYYLNGNAAFRLILYMKEGTAGKSLGGREAAGIGMGMGQEGQDGGMVG